MAPDGGTRHHCNQHQISAGTGELYQLTLERNAAGNLFHVRGPLTAKLRWPVVARVNGTALVSSVQSQPCEWTFTQ